MRRAVLFGLLALLPAAANASAPAGMKLTVAGCAGGTLAITLPLRPDAPSEQSPTCCAKGCHTRKRGVLGKRGA